VSEKVELETNSKNKNIKMVIERHKGIKENDDLLSDSHNLLNRWR
jgi:hypothetical protein